MDLAETFRLSLSERLEAAAEEIFQLFQQSVAQYEEEIKRQRRLLDVAWKPHVKLQRIEFQQQDADQQEEEEQQEDEEQIKVKEETNEQQLKEEQEEVLVEQQLWDHWRNPEVKPEPPMMEEEQQEVTQESDDDVPVSGSHEGSTDGTVSWNPDESVERLPEPAPAAEGDQHQAGPADQAADFKKPHRCGTCGKQFKRADHLKVHVKIHTGKKLFQCQICKKRFTRSDNLKMHVRTHKEKQVFQCQTCGRQFPHAGTLKEHIMRHNGEKPHGCHICGKAFTTKCERSRHIRVHTGEKPHVCKICGRGFGQSYGLKSHHRLIHSDQAKSGQSSRSLLLVKKPPGPSGGQ